MLFIQENRSQAYLGTEAYASIEIGQIGHIDVFSQDFDGSGIWLDVCGHHALKKKIWLVKILFFKGSGYSQHPVSVSEYVPRYESAYVFGYRYEYAFGYRYECVFRYGYEYVFRYRYEYVFRYGYEYVF